MRRFFLERIIDDSGVSGLGKVCEGCQFDNGWVGLIWLTDSSTLCWYPSVDAVLKIHGHGGHTQLVWIDDESSNVVIER